MSKKKKNEQIKTPRFNGKPFVCNFKNCYSSRFKSGGLKDLIQCMKCGSLFKIEDD